ncbi:hypothetical protein MMU07_00980 [Aquiflexum sp. LQ15W]|uniref:hypothetical protein n=1 Tax=Cognataquiflexum nitidum TaxID=2922272 RepID=UPI001F13E053|nr:hypothetical protein [Cognataquiflexum nitidum]MCH6198135.1 hypothetical protein [Cognataquiflexum nitidum]
MKTISGTYHHGKLSLDKHVKTKKPVRVKVVFEEIIETEESLKVSDLSFLEMQQLLQNCQTSLADELIKERRREL